MSKLILFYFFLYVIDKLKLTEQQKEELGEAEVTRPDSP